MTTISFTSRPSTSDTFRRVTIMQTDIANMTAIGREQGSGPAYAINLSIFHGAIAHNPAKGEEWIINMVLNQWVLYGRTSFQNPALPALQASDSGTAVFANHGILQFIDTQVEVDGGPLIVTGPISRTPVSVSVYNSPVNTINSGGLYSITGWTGSSPDGSFTNSTGVFTCHTAGVYAINFRVKYDTISTGRTFLEMYLNGTGNPRRVSFPFDAYGHLSTVVSLAVGNFMNFNTYYTNTNTPQNADCRIEMIGLV